MKHTTMVMAIFAVATMAAPAWSSEGHAGVHDANSDTQATHCDAGEHEDGAPADCATHMETQVGAEGYSDHHGMRNDGHHGEHATGGQSDHHDSGHDETSSEHH